MADDQINRISRIKITRWRWRRLFIICGLTIPSWDSVSEWRHEARYENYAGLLLRYYYSTVSKVHETVNGQRSRVFIIFSRNSRGSVARFIQSVRANLHMNYFLENTCCEACQAEGYSSIE